MPKLSEEEKADLSDVMDGLIEVKKVLDHFDGGISMENVMDWRIPVLKAISETGQKFNRLERIGILLVCKDLLSYQEDEIAKRLVNAVVGEFNEKKEVI